MGDGILFELVLLVLTLTLLHGNLVVVVGSQARELKQPPLSLAFQISCFSPSCHALLHFTKPIHPRLTPASTIKGYEPGGWGGRMGGRPVAPYLISTNPPLPSPITRHPPTHTPSTIYILHLTGTHHEASDVPASALYILLHGAAARPALRLLQGESKAQAKARAWGASQAAYGRGGRIRGQGRGMRMR